MNCSRPFLIMTKPRNALHHRTLLYIKSRKRVDEDENWSTFAELRRVDFVHRCKGVTRKR